MKICTNCNGQLPDNFTVCTNCGAPLPPQSTVGSVPMQMFMYDGQMGNKIGTGQSWNWVLYVLMASIFLFVIIIPIVVISSCTPQVMIITLGIWFTIIFITIIMAFVVGYKKSVVRTAYIYYDGILYREMLYGGQGVWLSGGNAAGSVIALIHNSKLLKDIEAKAQNPSCYLQLFARYSNGEKVWNSITGGDGKIDALKGFRITGENNRQYNYTYIDEKGKLKSGKLLKCYPNIEKIFGFCQ